VNLRRLRGGRDRVAVVDDQGVDRRVGREQVAADRRHVDGPGAAAGEQVRPIQRGLVDRIRPAGRQKQPSRRVAPVARERREARHGTHGVAAAARALHAVVQPDRGGPRLPVVAREAGDFVRADAAQRGDAVGIEGARALGQRVEAQRVAMDVVAVQPPFAHQHVDHAERERPVRAGHQRDVLVALLGRQRAIRVDRDELRAAPLGFLRAAPEMQIRRDGVGAPEDDQPGVLELFDIRTEPRAEGRGEGFAAGRRADRAVEEAGPELVEEAARHRFALHQSHGASVAVRHDALWIARGDVLQPAGDIGQRDVPAHALEAALALAAHAAQRMQHTIGVIGALEIPADLGAEHSRRGRMRRIAGDLHRDALAVLLAHRDQHGAGIRAVVRTRRPHHRLCRPGVAHGHAPVIGRSIMRPKKASQAATCS
jgi:hypothetical protein